MGPSRDVGSSRHVDAERHLRESEERYRRLFETAQDGVLLLDAGTGQITDVNPFLVSMLGYSHREFLGKKLWEVGPFRNVIASKRYFKELQRKGYVRYENLPLQTKQGELIEVEFVSNSYLVGSGKVVQCNVRNITDRRKAETELARSRALLDTVMAKAPVGFAFLDQELRCVKVNDALAEIDGIPAKKHIGRTAAEILPKMPAVTSMLRKALKGKPFIGIEIQGGTHGAPGAGRTWLANGYPVKNAAGDVQGLGIMVEEITERKRNETDILREKDKAKQYLDLVGVIVVALDENGKVLIINKKGSELLGHKEREIIGKDWFRDFVPKRMRKEVLGAFANIKSGKMRRIEHFENPVLTRDKRERLISWHNINVTQNGKFIYSLSSGEDVTERREAERLLRESEVRFRRVFEHSPIGMLLAHPDFKFTRVNPAACRMLRYGDKELMRMTFKDITYPDDLAKDIAQIKRLTKGEIAVYKTEKRYVRKGGDIVWAAINVSVIHDDDGKLRYYLALIDDITEKKLMEDRIIESQSRLLQLLEFLPDPTFALNTERRITLWNDAMAELSGLSEGSMLGKDSSRIGLHFYGRRRPVAAELVLDQGRDGSALYDSIEKAGGVFVARNFVPRLNRGKPGYVWVMAKPITDAEGNVIGAIESVRDVTAQTRSEMELVREKEKVEELSLARDRFIADITHELKTPLSVILLHLDMVLRSGSRIDDSTLQSYDLMWRNAQRLSRSIEQIMRLTNLDAVAMHKERVKLGPLIGNVVEEYLPLIRSKGLVLEVRGPPLSLECDPHLLSMVVSNLMSNAVKFTEKGMVKVRWSEEDGSVAIAVSDTGVGVLPENRGKIFGKFFKENPNAPGSGIGLALSSEIAKKMGGKMEYRSPGRGSTFRVIVPKR